MDDRKIIGRKIYEVLAVTPSTASSQKYPSSAKVNFSSS
jgi:hypothetical protein